MEKAVLSYIFIGELAIGHTLTGHEYIINIPNNGQLFYRFKRGRIQNDSLVESPHFTTCEESGEDYGSRMEIKGGYLDGISVQLPSDLVEKVRALHHTKVKPAEAKSDELTDILLGRKKNDSGKIPLGFEAIYRQYLAETADFYACIAEIHEHAEKVNKSNVKRIMENDKIPMATF